MGLFEKIFGKKGDVVPKSNGGFQTLTAYRPSFRVWDGNLYESELVRAAIDAKARNISKLSVTFNGAAKPALKTLTRIGPNSWQTWGQFLYRLATIYETTGTGFIVPELDGLGEARGYSVVLPTGWELIDVRGEPWVRFHFKNGHDAAIELASVGIMVNHQYEDDFFGTGNEALRQTMDLLTIQQQGIEEGVKNSATFRFMARMSNFAKPSDLAAERRRFNRENLQDESGGILLFPNTYDSIQQIESKPFVADSSQLELIRTNVFNYFGVNEDVLQNKCYGDAWNAFYEGAVEPFAIQLGDVMTRMTYSPREIGNGNHVFVTSNRLQYMSNADKLNVSAQLADRGIMNRDEIREIWNLPPLPNGEGQAYIIRGEYKPAEEQIEGGKPDEGNQ